jgi:hypothetical protein
VCAVVVVTVLCLVSLISPDQCQGMPMNVQGQPAGLKGSSRDRNNCSQCQAWNQEAQQITSNLQDQTPCSAMDLSDWQNHVQPLRICINNRYASSINPVVARDLTLSNGQNWTNSRTKRGPRVHLAPRHCAHRLQKFLSFFIRTYSTTCPASSISSTR